MKKFKYKYNPDADYVHDKILYSSIYNKKSKLWKETEALFWELVYNEEISIIDYCISKGCCQTPRYPACQ